MLQNCHVIKYFITPNIEQSEKVPKNFSSKYENAAQKIERKTFLMHIIDGGVQV